MEWIFQDANPYVVTADDGSFTSIKTGLANGRTYSYTFGQAGTYRYHRFIHPQMLGTVVVQEPPGVLRPGRRSRRPHRATATRASLTIEPDILEVPSSRSRKMIGTSVTRNPRRQAR